MLLTIAILQLKAPIYMQTLVHVCKNSVDNEVSCTHTDSFLSSYWADSFLSASCLKMRTSSLYLYIHADKSAFACVSVCEHNLVFVHVMKEMVVGHMVNDNGYWYLLHVYFTGVTCTITLLTFPWQLSPYSLNIKALFNSPAFFGCTLLTLNTTSSASCTLMCNSLQKALKVGWSYWRS